MPLPALRRRALVALAALAAGLIAASPAVAAFPAPTITPDAGSPANGVHTKNTSPSFTIDGGGNPFDWCFVRTASGAVGCSSPGGATSPATATLPDDNWTLIAETGPDPSDNSFTSTSTSFVVDTIGPDSPLPGPQTLEATGPSGRTVQYTPTAFDAGDGHAVPVTCNPAAGTPQVFPLGTTTVNCSASDSLGNTTSGSFTVAIVDTTAPSVPALLSPAPNAPLGTSTPNLSWAKSTDAVGVINYRVFVDGVQVATVQPLPPQANGNPSYTTAPLGSGPHSWFVQAVDAAANVGTSATRSFTIGTAPAAPVVTGPPALSNVATPAFSWTAQPGAAYYQWSLSGKQSRTGITGATSVTLPALADGGYTFTVTAASAFGAGQPSVPWPFAVDTTPPKLVTSGSASLAPAPGSTDVGTLSAIEVAFSEPVAPLTGANLRLCAGLCGSAVSAAVTSNQAKATLVPNAPLRGSTSYQVVLSGVTDLAGNALQLPSGSWTWTFHTAQDVAPPDPVTGLTLTPGVAQIGLEWVLPTSGGLGKIRVVRRDGTAPTGPADPAAVAFDLAPTAHSYTDASVTPNVHYFYALYSYDAFGNPSATAATGDATPLAPAEPPGVAPGGGTPVAPPVGPPVVAPPDGTTPPVTPPVVKGLLRTGRLSPVKGTTLRSLRPLLRWKGIGKRAALYNVQIFLGSRKVLSAFPRTTSYRVPKGKLKPGKTYLWRVWPYLGKKYTKTALGISYFVTASKIQAELPAATAVTR